MNHFLRVALALFLAFSGSQRLFAESFYAAGVSALPQSSPKPTGWSAVCVKASNSVWSISGLDYSIADRKIQQVAWSAIATEARTAGSILIFVLAGGGASTTGTASGYAVTGGTLGYVPIGKTGKFGAFVLGWTVQRTNVGTQNFAKFGWGKEF